MTLRSVMPCRQAKGGGLGARRHAGAAYQVGLGHSHALHNVGKGKALSHGNGLAACQRAKADIGCLGPPCM